MANATVLWIVGALALVAGCSEPPPAPLAGYVEAEFTRVAAAQAGRLTVLAVERGASVAAGAPLFTVEDDDEAAALRASQARERSAQAVARDLGKGERRDELAAAQAALDAARATSAQAGSDLQRQRALAAQGFVSGAGLDALVARRDAAAADERRLAAQLRTGRLAARTDRRDAAQADVQAAGEAVAQSRIRLRDTAATAPAAARVEDTLYRPGEWVAAGAPVVSLLEPGALKLRFFVPQAQLARVPVGARVSVSCDGCGAPFEAAVRFVARQAEFTPPVIYSEASRQRLVFLVEAWPDAQHAARLHPGLPVDVRLPAP
jgi:HlyD family secretion protein